MRNPDYVLNRAIELIHDAKESSGDRYRDDLIKAGALITLALSADYAKQRLSTEEGA